MRAVKIASIVFLALLAVACTEEKTRSGEQPKADGAATAARQAQPVDELPSPAGAGAAEPFLSATRDGVLLSWLEPVANTDRVALRFSRYAKATFRKRQRHRRTVPFETTLVGHRRNGPKR